MRKRLRKRAEASSLIALKRSTDAPTVHKTGTIPEQPSTISRRSRIASVCSGILKHVPNAEGSKSNNIESKMDDQGNPMNQNKNANHEVVKMAGASMKEPTEQIELQEMKCLENTVDEVGHY